MRDEEYTLASLGGWNLLTLRQPTSDAQRNAPRGFQPIDLFLGGAGPLPPASAGPGLDDVALDVVFFLARGLLADVLLLTVVRAGAACAGSARRRRVGRDRSTRRWSGSR
jgi:hypothetical protein